MSEPAQESTGVAIVDTEAAIVDTGGPRFVVGLGASAGGLEALRPLIAALTPTGEICYVVVQHMAPQYASLLSELLARDSQLLVKTADDGETLLPDRVYVTPPNHDSAVRDGRIWLTPPINTVGPKPSIDVLFASLAQSYGERAVGVVLSGTGSDGTHGSRAIKAEGGVVLSQSRTSAKHDGMPMSALRASVVDYELEIAELAKHLNTLHTAPRVELTPRSLEGSDELLSNELRRLLELVYRATQVDFSQYKLGTIRRQVERRMLALRVPTLSDYLAVTAEDPDELITLQRSFLISVTSFFRDREAFAGLREAVRKLCERKPRKSSFRVWVPGCATGEEAYSIAMLVDEVLAERVTEIDVRIFATDIDSPATDFARAGLYSAAALDAMGEEMRSRYFTEDSGGYRIAKFVRDRCVFARQDMVRDAPFLRMDLVSCRNVLIYLKTELQEDLLGKFHYALNPGGVLFLGKSESVPTNSPLFGALDPKNRLFQRRAVPSPRTLLPAHVAVPRTVVAPAVQRSAAQQRIQAVQELLSRSYAPPSILLGPSNEPSHFFGDSKRYLTFSEGSADFTFPSLVMPELRSEARTLLFRANQGNEDCVVGFPIRVTLGEVPSSVRLRIHKTFVDVNAGERCLLVVFEEMQIAPAPAADLVVADGARIELLQNDLQSTREHLQAVIEELETSNEELQSLNEELQAASEELQASNEELQTTNEELQATNEELTTVNDELSVKSQESQHLSETLTNIQNSVQTGIVVVDRQGRILRYNRLAVRFFGIMPEDLGTSLYGLPSYLPLPNLRANVERAIDGQASLERCERDGLHFVVQFAPYLAEAGGCSGTVISLLDVTELRRAEMELARSERRFRHLADALDEVVWMRTPTGSTLYVSPSYARLSGKDVANLESAEATFLDAVHPDDRARVAAAHQRATEASWVLEFRIARDDGSVRHVEERGRPVTDDAGLPAFLVSSLVDVTDRVHKEAALREGLAMASQLRSVAAAVPGGIFSALVDAALTTEISYASPRLGELVGLALDDLVGDPRSLVERLPAEERERLRGSLAHSVQTLAPWEETFRVQRPDGAERWLEVRAFAERAEDGRAVIHGFCHDVSARKASENSLARSEARYRGLFEQALSGIAELGLDGTLLQCNHRLAQLLGVPVGALLGQALQARAHPEDQSRLATLLAPHVRGAGADEAIEVRFQHHDGHYVWTAVVAGPILDAAGWPVGLTCVVSDIHALKAAQQQAAELDALLGSIVTTALDAVVSVDGEQRVAVFNPAAERLFGVGAAEVLGQNIRQLFPESDQATHPFLSHPLRVDGMHTAPTASGPIEVVGRHHNGTALPLEASFSYVDTGESMRCTAIVRDIRERRLAEQRIMTLNAELTRLNRSLDARAQSITSELSLRTEALERSNLELQQFAYVASHDLQTPLNAIAGFLELLQVTYSDALDDRGREWIGRAVEGAQRLKLLIRGLLDFARMDNVAQRFVDVDLEQLCDETFQTLRSSSDGRNAKLTRTALPQIMGDRLQIAQLLQNLLSNALKYRGERPPEVHVSARTEGDEVVVEVRDNGIGVSPLYHERIFEMFKRLHDERAYPGAGIGLALCRRIVHRHGGRIGLSSVPGEGSTFWFSVPRPTVAVLPEEVSEQQAEP